uniref:Uncharacterized protein n=1 Tax=Globodera rostochiensis TaxID=31243 RepID=A0A914GZQ4_GLORO
MDGFLGPAGGDGWIQFFAVHTNWDLRGWPIPRNVGLKKVAVDVNADEKRPIVGERSSGADGTGGAKLWAPQTPQGKIVVFECGSSGTEETNSS